MVVIGIDPGTATTGYGVVRSLENGDLELVDYGIVTTKAGKKMPSRLYTLYRELNQVLEKFKPDTAAVEKLYFQKNVTTAISVGQARGVALLSMAQADITVSEYAPNEVKIAVSGYGSADKRQMQSMVKALLKMESFPEPDDAADALAVAICHCHSMKLKNLGEKT